MHAARLGHAVARACHLTVLPARHLVASRRRRRRPGSSSSCRLGAAETEPTAAEAARPPPRAASFLEKSRRRPPAAPQAAGGRQERHPQTRGLAGWPGASWRAARGDLLSPRPPVSCPLAPIRPPASPWGPEVLSAPPPPPPTSRSTPSKNETGTCRRRSRRCGTRCSPLTVCDRPLAPPLPYPLLTRGDRAASVRAGICPPSCPRPATTRLSCCPGVTAKAPEATPPRPPENGKLGSG